MPRNHVSASFLLFSGNGHLDQPVQTRDYALNAAAALQIDNGVVAWREDIARADDVGTPEEYDAVSVCMRRRLVNDLNPLAIKVHGLFISDVGIGRQRSERDCRLTRGWRRAHAIKHLLMR